MAGPSSRGIYLREPSACRQTTEVRTFINLVSMTMVMVIESGVSKLVND